MVKKFREFLSEIPHQVYGNALIAYEHFVEESMGGKEYKGFWDVLSEQPVETYVSCGFFWDMHDASYWQKVDLQWQKIIRKEKMKKGLLVQKRCYGVRLHVWYRWEGRVVKSDEYHYHQSRSHLLKMIRQERRTNLDNGVLLRASFKIFKSKREDWP